ncbi:MAG: ABC transporter permease [Anaerolineae bacterium]
MAVQTPAAQSSSALPHTTTMSPQPRRSSLFTWGKRLLWLNMVLSFLFLYLPIVVLVAFSFNDSRLAARWEGFTFKWYGIMLNNEAVLTAFWNSIVVAVVSTIIATILGTMTGIAMERFRFPFRKTYDGILYLPVIVPDIVMGVSLLAFFALALDLVNSSLMLEGDSAFRPGLGTVIIAHVAFNISFVAIVVRTSLRDFNKALEEAAMDLGANEWTTFKRVTLPLIMPGILGGALLAFTLSLDDFVITFFTTGPGGTTLPIDVFGRIKRAISPEINAISTVMLMMSIVLVIASQIMQRRQNS